MTATSGPLGPLGRSGGRDLLQLPLQLEHALDESSAVDFELGLTRTPRSNHAGLLREGDASAPQPWEAVTQEGQFHLGLAFRADRVLGEDVQDDRGPGDRRASELLL